MSLIFSSYLSKQAPMQKYKEQERVRNLLMGSEMLFFSSHIWISCNKHGCKTSQHLVRNNLTTLTNVETQSGTVVPGLAAVRQLIEHMYCEQTYVT